MYETIISHPVAVSCITSIGLTLVRGIAGYLEKWKKTGKRPKFDFNKWLETYLRMIPQVISLSVMGVPVEAAVGTDWLIGKLKK